MSNDYVDYVMELIYEDIDREDKKGLLNDEINQLSIEHNLDADDDREGILIKLAEQRLEESFQ